MPRVHDEQVSRDQTGKLAVAYPDFSGGIGKSNVNKNNARLPVSTASASGFRTGIVKRPFPTPEPARSMTPVVKADVSPIATQEFGGIVSADVFVTRIGIMPDENVFFACVLMRRHLFAGYV
jgi:hypothetical protein